MDGLPDMGGVATPKATPGRERRVSAIQLALSLATTDKRLAAAARLEGIDVRGPLAIPAMSGASIE
jgi:hypothetical protein